ncbi:hypothetical protein V8F20_011413 [Naviculisporaceae sp. PSN 640]
MANVMVGSSATSSQPCLKKRSLRGLLIFTNNLDSPHTHFFLFPSSLSKEPRIERQSVSLAFEKRQEYSPIPLPVNMHQNRQLPESGTDNNPIKEIFFRLIRRQHDENVAEPKSGGDFGATPTISKPCQQPIDDSVSLAPQKNVVRISLQESNEQIDSHAIPVFDSEHSHAGCSQDGPKPENTDSGYSSNSSTPMKSQEAMPEKHHDRPSKLRVVSANEITEELHSRFMDLKVLYSKPLLEAVSKGRRRHGDISMKFKCPPAADDEMPEAYIVIHCDKRAAKRVRNFFNQTHVKEDLGPDFKVQIVDTGLVSLSSLGRALVYGDGRSGTLCGTSIVITHESGSNQAMATLGGIILATYLNGTRTILYGLTAGHAIAKAYGQDYYDAINSSSEQDDESDSDDDEESCLNEADVPVSASGGQHTVDASKLPVIGIVNGARLPPETVNHDWGLVPFLNAQYMNHIQIGFHATPCIPFSEEHISLKNRITAPVVVITSRGNQKGTLENNGSSLLSTIGKEFVSVFDFTPDSESSLAPGDSGAWVAHSWTGEVYGHVVSVDSFGEAYVMPIQGTLREIRSHLHADLVRLPSEKDVGYFQDPKGASIESKKPHAGEPDSGYSTMHNTPCSALNSLNRR